MVHNEVSRESLVLRVAAELTSASTQPELSGVQMGTVDGSSGRFAAESPPDRLSPPHQRVFSDDLSPLTDLPQSKQQRKIAINIGASPSGFIMEEEEEENQKEQKDADTHAEGNEKGRSTEENQDEEVQQQKEHSNENAEDKVRVIEEEEEQKEQKDEEVQQQRHKSAEEEVKESGKVTKEEQEEEEEENDEELEMVDARVFRPIVERQSSGDHLPSSDYESDELREYIPDLGGDDTGRPLDVVLGEQSLCDGPGEVSDGEGASTPREDFDKVEASDVLEAHQPIAGSSEPQPPPQDAEEFHRSESAADRAVADTEKLIDFDEDDEDQREINGQLASAEQLEGPTSYTGDADAESSPFNVVVGEDLDDFDQLSAAPDVAVPAEMEFGPTLMHGGEDTEDQAAASQELHG